MASRRLKLFSVILALSPSHKILFFLKLLPTICVIMLSIPSFSQFGDFLYRLVGYFLIDYLLFGAYKDLNLCSHLANTIAYAISKIGDLPEWAVQT